MVREIKKWGKMNYAMVRWYLLLGALLLLLSCGDDRELTGEERMHELEGTLAGTMIDELNETLIHALPGAVEEDNALPSLIENNALPGALPSVLPGALPSYTAKYRNQTLEIQELTEEDIDFILDTARARIIELDVTHSDDENLLLPIIMKVVENYIKNL